MADKMKEAIERLEIALEYLLTDQKSVAYLKQNKEFQTILKNEIYILKSVTKEGDNKVNEVIQKYNSASPVMYDNKPTVSLNDDTEKIDYTNYLITYVRNIFKIDLRSIDKKDLKKVQKIEEKEVKSVNEANEEAAFAAGVAFDDGSGMMGGGYGNYDPNSPTITIPNPAIQQQAQAVVNEKILRGEVYMFTSKPKVIPTFKIIYTIAMCLFAACLIGACVCTFMLNGAAMQFPGIEGTLYLQTIGNGVFCILFALLFIYMGFADMIRAARIHAKTKTKPSDNEKYQVTGFGVGFTILFGILIVFMLLFPSWNIGLIIYNWEQYMVSDVSKQICMALVILTSISFGALLLVIIAAIVLLVCKPKVNINLLNRLMEEEMKKLMGQATMRQDFYQEPAVETPKKEEPKKPDKDLKN